MKMRGGSFSFYEDDTNMAQVIPPIPIMPQEKKKAHNRKSYTRKLSVIHTCCNTVAVLGDLQSLNL